ncbi:hypothetical protein H6769_03375 [Candidatus Peribacteria bacterium]|nr:hypothetical protein [Candidatus Peribacteria bacterium]
MRDNQKSTLPLIREIFFEPKKSINVDKIRWLIEKEEFWLGQENLRKCDLRALSS